MRGQVLAELVADEVVGAVEDPAIVLLGRVEHGGVRRLEREGDQLTETPRRAWRRRSGAVGFPQAVRMGLRMARLSLHAPVVSGCAAKAATTCRAPSHS